MRKTVKYQALKTIWASTILILSGAIIPSVSASQQIPPSPQYYVLDEPHVLSKSIYESIQTLLVQHDHLTGEQVVIAIFNNLNNEDIVTWTNQVFTNWQIGQRGKDNGVLLALYWSDHKARIEVGYGLEPILTDAKSKDLLENYLTPELRNTNPDRAISLTTLQILRILDSPLLQNGKAEEILRSGGFQGSWKPIKTPQHGWSVWLILGFILLIIVLNILTTAEAHFSRDGWFRPSPWPKRRLGKPWGSGSDINFGRNPFGDFKDNSGGFTGGGGRSGGGGATGDW